MSSSRFVSTSLAQRVLTIAVVMLVAAGCRRPARIELDTPSHALLDGSPFALHGRALGRDGEPFPDVAVTYTVNPAGIVEVSSGGDLRCLVDGFGQVRTGDVAVTAAARGVVATATIKCRSVTAVVAPTLILTAVGGPSVPVEVKLVGADGGVVSDVVPAITVRDADIAVVQGGSVRGVSLGSTWIRVPAGSAFADVAVDVASMATSQTVDIPANDEAVYPLSAGAWELEVDVKSANIEGLSFAWTRGSCAQRDERISMRCQFADAGALTMKNAIFNAPLLGTIRMSQVPPTMLLDLEVCGSPVKARWTRPFGSTDDFTIEPGKRAGLLRIGSPLRVSDLAAYGYVITIEKDSGRDRRWYWTDVGAWDSDPTDEAAVLGAIREVFQSYCHAGQRTLGGEVTVDASGAIASVTLADARFRSGGTRVINLPFDNFGCASLEEDETGMLGRTCSMAPGLTLASALDEDQASVAFAVVHAP